MPGMLFGVGVGPGDPELMTLQAVRIIKESPIVAFPGEDASKTVAYDIVKKVIPEIAQKECLAIAMPMTKDLDKMRENHMAGAAKLIECLKQEKNVAFLCLGDPSIYSTYSYLAQLVEKQGYQTQMVSGVPSFCAAAAKGNVPLTMWDESLQILPATHFFEKSGKAVASNLNLDNRANYVFMKSGKQLEELKVLLKHSGKRVIVVENCGMANEQVYYGLDSVPEKTGYYTLVIARNEEL